MFDRHLSRLNNSGQIEFFVPGRQFALVADKGPKLILGQRQVKVGSPGLQNFNHRLLLVLLGYCHFVEISDHQRIGKNSAGLRRHVRFPITA